jgi:hypothetical protein
MTDLYRMFDSDPAGMFPVQKAEAKDWNAKGWGIFWTVNDFGGQARRKENLRRIIAWAIDMDDGTKAEQHARLLRSPLIPSLIVETKSGFHAYWLAAAHRDLGAPKADHWNAIVLERLVPFFGSDKNARDLCRVLRVPGFRHMKDPAHPFDIRIAWKQHVAYTEPQIAEAFPWVPDKKAHQSALAEAQRAAQTEAREASRRAAIAAGLVPTETLWEAIWNLDCEDGLQRLSGHWAVGGEAYTFRTTGRGNLNLFVNGKPSSVFVDQNKRIGSLDGGGPTLVQWLRWFRHPWATVLDVLFEIFPHLRDVDAAAKKGRAA